MFKKLTGYSPSISHVIKFGCEICVQLSSQLVHALEAAVPVIKTIEDQRLHCVRNIESQHGEWWFICWIMFGMPGSEQSDKQQISTVSKRPSELVEVYKDAATPKI